MAEDDPRYLAAAVCVSTGRDDEGELQKALRATASWGKVLHLRRLLASCHVPASACGGALVEASERGFEEVVAELLRAGAYPGATDGSAHRKTALHFACEQGHEGVARHLLAAKADLKSTDASGRTPCDLAREQDLGMLPKRLEKLV